MFSDSFPSTPLYPKFSREASQEPGFMSFNENFGGSNNQFDLFQENGNSQAMQQIFVQENRFASNTTRYLMNNSSLDNPMDSRQESEHQDFDNWFGGGSFGSNEDQADFNIDYEPSTSKKKQVFESSNTQLGEEISNNQNFEEIAPLDLEDRVPVINNQPSDLFVDEQETFTGKYAPVEDKKISKAKQPKNKVQRKRIQKESTGEAKSRPKKSNKTQTPALFGGMASLTGEKTTKTKRESKNIVKNYGKAMASFSLTPPAIPYLEVFLAKHEVSFDDFKNFIINNKETIDGIGTLRNLLDADIFDEPMLFKTKSVFRDICQVFLQDFAINWIFASSRSHYKAALLACRFNMLRRIKNPSSFTYLKPQ